jgi:hypothetical protein
MEVLGFQIVSTALIRRTGAVILTDNFAASDKTTHGFAPRFRAHEKNFSWKNCSWMGLPKEATG